MTGKLPGLTFFFPAYNEEEHVEAVVAEALNTLPRFAERLEIIIIDDGSADRTPELADALAAAHPEVSVVHHKPNRGYGGAVRSGLLSARQPFVFFTDGDRQFGLDDLRRLIAEVDEADAVIGYRIKRMDPPRRLLIAWVYNRLISVLFGGGFRDVDCAFKLFRTSVFQRMPLDRVKSNGAFFSAELLINLRRAGIPMKQVGVPHYPRTLGEATGANPRIILRAIRDLLTLRFRG